MMWPPMMMRMRLQNSRHSFGLYLPLVLMLPLVLALALIVLPFLLVSALVLWVLGWGNLLRATWHLIGTLCALRGLKVDVKRGPEQLYISFY